METNSILSQIKASFPRGKDVVLVAVSKFQPADVIRRVYDEGQRIFAESRVQELQWKAEELPDDICWHFIGHLQTNKVAKLLGIRGLELIQSVDSFKLLECIDREAAKSGKVVKVLLEVHVAREDTKFGFAPSELIEWINGEQHLRLTAVEVCGVMGMASNTDDEERVKADFKAIAEVFDMLKQSVPSWKRFNILSMGMSGDYRLAIEEGANMVRIGSSIFGERHP